MEEGQEERLRRLEKREDAEQFIHTAGFVCDAGPYPPGELSAMWAADGYYDTGSSQVCGRDELYSFYDSLAAQYTIHFFTNAVLEPEDGSDLTMAHCYCFEAPVLDEVAHFGTFEHDIEIRTARHELAWLRRVQQVNFLVRFERGWSSDADLIADQFKAG